jgi:DNA-binding transcriptional regulator GbsR (MarR family)
LETRWGINPTVAQIHALLYSRSAPCAEEIADAISAARCKISTSLKEL